MLLPYVLRAPASPHPATSRSVVSADTSLQFRMLQSPRSTSAALPDHDDQRSGLVRSTRLQQHLELAAVVLLHDEQVRLALIEGRPGCIALERRQRRALQVVPQRDLADRLRSLIDHLDFGTQRDTGGREIDATRDEAALHG